MSVSCIIVVKFGVVCFLSVMCFIVCVVVAFWRLCNAVGVCCIACVLFGFFGVRLSCVVLLCC